MRHLFDAVFNAVDGDRLAEGQECVQAVMYIRAV